MVAAYRGKLALLFSRLAGPGYALDPHYADQLLLQLDPGDPEIAKLLGSPFFSDLLLDSLAHVETASVPVRVFYLNLITAAATNELQFTKLLNHPSFSLLAKVVDISQTDVSPSIRVAFIKMASTLTTHCSGIAWILETDSWKHIFNLCYQSQTVYVLRAAYKFSSDLLWKLNEFGDEDNLIKILEYILKPILESLYHQVETISEEDEASLIGPLQPSLHMLLSTLTKVGEICKPNAVVKALNSHFTIKYSLIAILHITRNDEVMLMISKICFLLSLSNVLQNKGPKTLQDFLELSICYFNAVHLFIQKRLVTKILDFCVSCNLYWSDFMMNHEITLESNGRTVDVQNQLIVIPLIPLICYVNGMNRVCKAVMDQYMIKLIDSSCEHTTRAAYAMRDLIYEYDAKDIAQQSIKRLFLVKNHLNRRQANTIFQGLFYVIKDFVPVDDSGDLVLNNDPQVIESKLPIMSLAIDAILMLLKGHNINWHESFETICLYNQICNILKLQNLPCKFVVQSLSLITLAVKKFIPPNLALLLESKDGSSLHEIGALINCKMHDHNWEIRDSALELLHECTEIAFVKYPPFQKLILANDLLPMAATMALNDGEFYVQASALKCLAAAAKTQIIWENLLTHHPDLYSKIFCVLKNNPEGVARKEAAAIVCELFQNQKINDSLKRCMYLAMSSVALEDLHWEVQLAALRFWRSVIHDQLAYQGMIDGKFPGVTFSKDKRKIVNLNETEIQKRLLIILENLSSIGCLNVLIKTLDEDADVEVMELSLSISEDFLKILKEYNVSAIIKNDVVTSESTEQPVKMEDVKPEMDLQFMEMDANTKSDAVIDGIVKTDDLNLLAHIYKSQLQIKSEIVKDEAIIDPREDTTERNISPFAFLKSFEDNDFKLNIEEKRKWNAGIRSLHSVLDDVLCLYESNDANSLDCY